MFQGLRDITKLLNNQQTIISNQKPKQLSPISRIHDIITISHQTIDFGQCVSGSIYERKFTITLKQNYQQPKVVSLAIICQDDHLNQLAQYIYGVRRQNNFEYFDEFKFKASQKGMYNFIVGVKTPHIADCKIIAKLLLTIEGANGQICVDLKQVARIPFIKCNKQLIDEDGFRILKLAIIKNKSRRETKLAFRCSENLNLTLFAELLGEDQKQCSEVQIRPRCIPAGNKGVFVISLITTCPNELTSSWICLRKILILRIKDTSIHYHFPVQITFYPESQRGLDTNVE